MSAAPRLLAAVSSGTAGMILKTHMLRMAAAESTVFWRQESAICLQSSASSLSPPAMCRIREEACHCQLCVSVLPGANKACQLQGTSSGHAHTQQNPLPAGISCSLQSTHAIAWQTTMASALLLGGRAAN